MNNSQNIRLSTDSKSNNKIMRFFVYNNNNTPKKIISIISHANNCVDEMNSVMKNSHSIFKQILSNVESLWEGGN